MQIIRRTFEAKKHPKGSPDRERLNGSWLTSEYYPSKRYALVADGSRYLYRTKAEAEACRAVLEGSD